MVKRYHYETAACEVKKKTIGASLKHFEPDYFKIEGVYASVMPFQYWRNVLKPVTNKCRSVLAISVTAFSLTL